LALRHGQDELLAGVGAPAPVYRWTTALDGFAVRLSPAQAAGLSTDPRVALVERSSVRRLAGVRTGPPASLSAGQGLVGPGRSHGGAGVVIGVVDSGIWPESPLFSSVPRLGPAPRGYTGTCDLAADFPAGSCNHKLVGAHWFVQGFGADRVASSASLSPLDDSGHGTQMASIAAGDAGVSVEVGRQSLGRYGGVAPQARLAVYKACWTAPDPDHDGCSTADLVTAIDKATADGVDVLNLSVAGSDGRRVDTVDRALLGATESGIVVVAAAGNAGAHRPAGHATPWVTTVGATTGDVRRGEVRLAGGPTLTGAMASTRGTRPARVVVGERVAAPGATRGAARVCTPGSLDAARVAGAVVLCDRGRIGRVDKSAAVQQADGVAMVLVNVRPGSVDADFHAVPTVHLDRDAGLRLRHWVTAHPRGRATLKPLGVAPTDPRVTPWSSGGDPATGLVKPDVLAPGTGVLGAVPPGVHGTRWDFTTGTSAATAYTSGAAALLLGEHHWSADVVRSALATTADPVEQGAPLLRQGAGRVRPLLAVRPGVAYPVRAGDYRRWLDGRLAARDVNTPSAVLPAGTSLRRTITNVGDRALYFSSETSGFAGRVLVTPAAVRLAPGASATYTLRSLAGTGRLDDGWVTWKGADGTRARIPVVVTR
ncbi:MAG: S8 family serine peptidase, partial [Mycobacteriales bacterium]